MESSGMSAALQDNHLFQERPATSFGKKTASKLRKRPMTAHGCCSQGMCLDILLL